jgi:tRNA (guanine6-N2)-methyltransferase
MAGSLRLDTVAGAEDLLLEEVGGLGATRIERPGVVDLEPAATWASAFSELSRLRYFTGAYLPIAVDQIDGALPELITAMAAFDLGEQPGFRVESRSADRRGELATKITEATGWTERPGDWMINIRPEEAEWLIDIGPLHWSRRRARLERLPWSTPAVVAEVLVRLLKVDSDHRLLDPCCGAGTNLVAAGLDGVHTLLGVDHDPAAVAAARTNLDRCGLPGTVREGSAEKLDLAPGSIDRVIANLPFGKQVGSHGGNQRLYPALLAEISRCLTPGGRAVLLTEDKNLLTDTVQRTSGIKIIKQRLLRYSGASPTAYVISRNAPRRRR